MYITLILCVYCDPLLYYWSINTQGVSRLWIHHEHTHRRGKKWDSQVSQKSCFCLNPSQLPLNVCLSKSGPSVTNTPHVFFCLCFFSSSKDRKYWLSWAPDDFGFPSKSLQKNLPFVMHDLFPVCPTRQIWPSSEYGYSLRLGCSSCDGG